MHEPVLEESEFYHSSVINDLNKFKQIADVIVANRPSGRISDVQEKVYARDFFGSD